MNEKDLIKQNYERVRTFRKFGLDIYGSRRFAVDAAAISKGKILEIGTGRGFLAAELAKRGYDLTSIDIDRKVQKFAKAMVKSKGLEKRVNFRIMDGRFLRFKDRSFDHVISMDFFHHLKSPVKCLNEMMRVAEQKVIIADLNKSGAKLFERIHAGEGRHHDRSRISFPEMKTRLIHKGFRAKYTGRIFIM